jgi:two-component system nitrate/nitrite sensor histidine kinase NarX
VHSISGPDEAFRVRAGAVCRATDPRGLERHAVVDCPVIRAEFARSHLMVPLKRGDETIGMLCAASREERVLSAAEAEFLAALTAQAAITFEHARLDAEVRRLAVLEERGRIARDMHDGLAQSVSLLHLRIRQAQAQVPPESAPSIANTLEELAIISGDMHDEIRHSISGLRTAAPEDPGLVPTLAEFVQEFSVQNRFPVEFSANKTAAVDLPVDATLQVIRIVQEALNNIRKHAQTDRAHVCVESQGSWLRVSVEDNGRGFDPAKMAAEDGVHFGLRGMQERADRCAGKLEVDSTPGRGTRVVLSVPLETPS